MTRRSVVAIGGGHGLYTSLQALRRVADDVTAIVTVADDGGSSGRLREEMGILPPGDLRMALSALCDDSEWGTTWRDVLQTRFSTSGPLNGHALGNLLIAGVWERTGDIVEGLRWVGQLLKADGIVLPLAAEPLEISAVVDGPDGPRYVRGQVAVASATGRLRGLRLEPAKPHVPQATLDALRSCDAIVMGPGSWFTSVLVHFLVEPVAQALVEAGRRTVITLNIAHEDAETADDDRVDDIRALRALEPRFRPAAVVVDSQHDDAELRAEIADWGAEMVVATMKREGSVDRHDVGRLAEQLQSVLATLEGPAGGPKMAG
jgi:uncharacterized cofD-like protein